MSFRGRAASVLGTAVDVVVDRTAVVGTTVGLVVAAVVGAAVEVVGGGGEGVVVMVVVEVVEVVGVTVEVEVVGAGVAGNSQMAETASGIELWPAAAVLRKHCFQAQVNLAHLGLATHFCAH